MSNTSAIVVGTLFGIFIVTALNLWVIERDRNMFNYYCTHHNMYCERP